MYEGFPKFKLPDLGFANPVFYGAMNLLLGATAGVKIQDVEFPNPLAMLNPFEMTPLVLKAFFSRDPMVPGETKEGGMLAMKSGQSRIPVIGPLIVAVTTYFEDLEGGGIDEDGNPIPDGKPDKKFDKALFKAGGALLGGFLGTFIPIPIIGTILGELVGEYVGELFYILMRGGGFSALGNKLKQDIESTTPHKYIKQLTNIFTNQFTKDGSNNRNRNKGSQETTQQGTTSFKQSFIKLFIWFTIRNRVSVLINTTTF
jgi:hypothetical protein